FSQAECTASLVRSRGGARSDNLLPSNSEAQPALRRVFYVFEETPKNITVELINARHPSVNSYDEAECRLCDEAWSDCGYLLERSLNAARVDCSRGHNFLDFGSLIQEARDPGEAG